MSFRALSIDAGKTAIGSRAVVDSQRKQGLIIRHPFDTMRWPIKIGQEIHFLFAVGAAAAVGGIITIRKTCQETR
jgi:hypothetical protein